MAGTITALTVQQKNKDRVNVYLDGHFAFGLAAIEAARLRRGQTLSDDEIAALQNRDEVQKAHESALHYLDYRPRSVDEIRRYLKGKHVAPETMDEVIERLAGVGLLDDRAFARYWLENRSDFSPRGERALRLELRQKGIPGDIIAEVLSEGYNEDNAAYRAAMAQARKVRTTDPVEFRRKMEAHLARRGFSYDTAREAVARAWSELQLSGKNYACGESEGLMSRGPLLTVITALVAAAIGGTVGYFFKQYQAEQAAKVMRIEQEHLIEEAQTKAKETVLAARDEALKLRDEVEAEAKRHRIEWQREEERVAKRREEYEQKLERLEQRERRINQRQSELDKRVNNLEKIEQQRMAELSRVSEMTREDAKKLLVESVEKEAREDMARKIRQVEAEAKEEAEKRAREVITLAVQRVASDQVSEIAVSTVALPADEMKGRIIGRAGRNIRAIEKATGVDIVVDDTPEAVTISSFDPVRREVARVALSKLILDGRIHPGRIEKLVEDARAEVNQTIKEEGERAALEAGVPGLHPEIIKLLGRLKFRTSYGQNQHQHAIETARLAAILAAELGADVKAAKMGGLLHDLGKAIDREVEGTHAQIGADLAKRYGVPEKVVNIIRSHHHEEDQTSLEAIIVEAADAISGARPGARRESLETYLKRVKDLEDIANSFQGVAQSFAIQAGREVRIVVKPEEIDDLASIRLSKDIAKKVEETMQYPGQIRVTVIRETRAVEYAK